MKVAKSKPQKKSTVEDEEEILECKNCGSTDIVADGNRGELICEKCGYVLETRLIDEGPEWRAFNSEERNKRSRVGSPSTFSVHDKGLSTIIGYETAIPSGINLLLQDEPKYIACENGRFAHESIAPWTEI